MSSDLDDSPPLEPQTTTELVGPEKFSAGLTAQPVQSSARLTELTKPFVESLEAGDKERGTKLAQMFKRYLEVHDSNATLRLNLKQVQFIYQQKLADYATSQGLVREMLDKLKPDKRMFQDRLDRLVELEGLFAKQVKMLHRMMLDTAEEIRKTEFGDETHVHIAVFQLAWNGIKGAINRRLHGKPEMQLLMDDLRNLAKSIGVYRRAGG